MTVLEEATRASSTDIGDLLTEFMQRAPYQPATNYWRAVEIGDVIRHGLPLGYGLDLGCGDGHLMAIVLQGVGPRELVGVDIDPHETAMAAARGIYREVVTVSGDRLPLPDSSFDFVFSNSVLEHVAPIDATLAEAARVLRPGGRFLFTVPGDEFHLCLRGPRWSDRTAYLRTVDQRCAHLRYWSAAQWREHLRSAGLEVIHVHGYLTQGQVRRWETLARYTSGILYRFGGGKKQPIDIQRQLGMRSARIRLPRPLASVAARVLGARVATGGTRFGCLLVEARK